MDEDNEHPFPALALYAVALAITLGGAVLGFAWGLARLLVRS